MVRCSIKRIIKILICLLFFLFLQKTISFSSLNQIKISSKKFLPLKIIILSRSYSNILSKFRLFINELHLSYEYYQEFDKNFFENSIEKYSLLFIIDSKQTKNFYKFINQYHISLIIIFNEQYSNSIKIKYSDMLFENLTYSTIDFNRNQLKIIYQSTLSPFRIQSLNSIIQLLTFQDILPIFRRYHSQCYGLPNNQYDQIVIYVKNRLTLEKINLLIISLDNQIFISECLVHYWFIWPLFMDIIRYLTLNEYNYYGFIRYIQIDIDDVFLGGKTYDRWTSDDIQALIRSQIFIRNFVKNFQYRLGFSGFYYDENEGDRALMKEKDQFIWFHHTWKHEKLTNINEKISLIASTESNFNFAQKYQLPFDRNYAVAPHHTGIYPINSIVYYVWREIMNITVTSTENYPYHYDLPSNHRGFIYRNLSVLPRQSCGLYTTTRYYNNYPNSSDHLEQYLMGGKLFRMILTNPITIFMSHNVNYGYDRLGNYVFVKLFYLISQWTRIKLSNEFSTIDLARKYFFQFYPDEQMPIFTNPCYDQRLMNLWNGNHSLCSIFPRLLIIGPQKTGTTALLRMLSQHQNLRPSKENIFTYEELQFFSNDTIYLNGINWYLNQFNTDSMDSSSIINFEKSATYFDSLLAMKRIKALLPDIRLIMIFTEPGARAYSRFQHELARNNQTIHFDDLLRLNHENKQDYFHLKQRCIQPGYYVEYLYQWLKYFSPKQIYIIDGDEFRRDPRFILNDIQTSFLQLNTSVNFSKLVRYNKKKGFFCPLSNNNHFQCLGNSKGRHYPPMSNYAREYLNRQYFSSNQRLRKLLQIHNYTLPLWLLNN